MGRKSLLKDVSRDELLKMRESGMTNADIANVLNVSSNTIRNYIGLQPGRGGRHAYIPETPKRQSADDFFRGSTVSASEPLPSACLAVTNRMVQLAGTCCRYDLDGRANKICIDGSLVIELDKLPDMIAELTAILGHIPELNKGNEMW